MQRSLKWANLTGLMLTTAMLSINSSLAEELAKVTLTIDAKGTDSTQSEGEWSKGEFNYQIEITTTLQTDGSLSSVNLYDPEYTAKAMAESAAKIEKINNVRAGKFDDSEIPPSEDRYLMYMGYLGCPTTISIKINESVNGAYADVAGMQGYEQTYSADWKGTDLDRSMLCLQYNASLDTKTNTLYRSDIGIPPAVGKFKFSEDNRNTVQNDSNAHHKPLPQIVQDYVIKTLTVGPASGTQSETLTADAPIVSRVGVIGGYSGTITVDMQWTFEKLPSQ